MHETGLRAVEHNLPHGVMLIAMSQLFPTVVKESNSLVVKLELIDDNVWMSCGTDTVILAWREKTKFDWTILSIDKYFDACKNIIAKSKPAE